MQSKRPANNQAPGTMPGACVFLVWHDADMDGPDAAIPDEGSEPAAEAGSRGPDPGRPGGDADDGRDRDHLAVSREHSRIAIEDGLV